MENYYEGRRVYAPYTNHLLRCKTRNYGYSSVVFILASQPSYSQGAVVIVDCAKQRQ